MVNKTSDSYSKILKEFDPSDPSTSSTLKGILNTYPFFQSASAYYLKTLKIQKKESFNELLPKTAILTHNRRILRNWIYKKEEDDNSKKVDQIEKYFKLKPSSIGPPKLYLGSKVSQITLPNGVHDRAFSAPQYVKESIKNVEDYMFSHNYRMSKKIIGVPLPSSYHPELDATIELNDEDANYYQLLIGIARWMVELGRIDINYEASIMSSHITLPRLGHLEKLFHIFGYLKHHLNARLVFYPTYPIIDYDRFPLHEWGQFYGEVV